MSRTDRGLGGPDGFADEVEASAERIPDGRDEGRERSPGNQRLDRAKAADVPSWILMAIEAGRILNQRYRLIQPIGHGSQGSVWVAEHLALTTQVAVKLIDQELAKKEAARERFRREATAAAQLRSAHVVQILDHGIDGDQPFIVMELLDGEDLFERLSHQGRLSLRETSRIVTQVARALSRAHQAGIVHRDLKPENVFIVPNEDDEIVKVLDFGVAKVSEPGKPAMQKTGVGTLIGTPHYMSPEQVRGLGEVDYRTDLWALGVIAYQCVTGELPFDSEGVGDLLVRITVGEIPVPSKALASIPAGFDAWFARACERDLTKRFQSARELAVALAAVCMATPPEVLRVPTLRPTGRASGADARRISTRPAPLAPVASARAGASSSPPEEALDAGELEEVVEPDGARPPFESTEIDFDFDDEPEQALRFSHEEFPLLVRIGAPAKPQVLLPAGRTLQGVAPPPPPPPPSSRTRAAGPVAGPAAPPSSAASPASSAQRASTEAAPPRDEATRSPVVMAPANSPHDGAAGSPIPGASAGPPSPAEAPPVRRTTESGFARPGMLSTNPPPELDGSRRRRLVRILAACLILGAIAIAWSVVRSHLRASAASDPTDAVTAAQPHEPSAPASRSPAPWPTSTTTAVDPGKVSRPVRRPPAGKGKPKASSKKVPDGVIEIPDGPDEQAAPDGSN